MKALDTNVLVRFLVQDDAQQTGTVNQLFKEAEATKQPLYVNLMVMLELIWVLQSVYKVSRKDLLMTINALLSMPALRFEHANTLRDFIQSAENNRFDLSDLLIGQANSNNQCEATLTFDKKAAKSCLFEAL